MTYRFIYGFSVGLSSQRDREAARGLPTHTSGPWAGSDFFPKVCRRECDGQSDRDAKPVKFCADNDNRSDIEADEERLCADELADN